MPQSLSIQKGNGKIHYPQVHIPATRFHLVHGEEFLQVYHVDDNDMTVAFSFCRKCAVHICNASDADNSILAFNATCLQPEYIPSAPVKQKKERGKVEHRKSDRMMVAECDDNLTSPDVVRPQPKQLAFTSESSKDHSIPNDSWHWQALSKEPTRSPSETPATPEGFPIECLHNPETESTISGSSTPFEDALSTTVSSFDETRCTAKDSSLDDTTTTTTLDPAVSRNQLRQFMKKHLKPKSPPRSAEVYDEANVLNMSLD